ITDIRVLNGNPKNQSDQNNDQRVFDQALAILFNEQPFKKLSHMVSPPFIFTSARTQCAFVVGTFMGAKLAGASKEH
ncbi:MAG TPA: hypothetical protein VF977_02645, partial [Candidatus Binatia bacterium]